MKTQTKEKLPSIVCGFLMLTIGITNSATLHVANSGDDDTGNGSELSPYRTIQKGIDSAQNGDVVVVLPGTYSGEGNRPLNLNGKGITVRSSQGPFFTKVNLEGHQAILAHSTESRTNTKVEGFTFYGGYATSGEDWGSVGIVDMRYSASITLEDCIFHNNNVTVSYLTTGGAIVSKTQNNTEGEKALIVNCLFYENTVYGGSWVGHSFSKVIGFGVQPLPGIDVDNCTIYGNHLTSYDNAGGQPLSAGFGNVANTIIWNNTPPANGRGCYASNFEYSISDVDVYNQETDELIFGINNANPHFIDPANANFALADSSPAVDAGDPSYPLEVDGSRIDMGFKLYDPNNSNFIFWGVDSPEGRLAIPSISNVKMIDAGLNHSVALINNGKVVAWGGDGGYGELIATVPPNLGLVTEIDCGWAWTLLRMDDGSLFGWGANDSGQLSLIPEGNDFVQISAGNMHGAALRSDGTIVCWGRNDFGQASVPDSLGRVLKVIASGHHTLALLEDGTVKGWGVFNNYAPASPPEGLENVVDIAAGDFFCIALKSDGTVIAWGDNTFGQTEIPLEIQGRASEIFATADVAFAAAFDGEVYAWGNSANGLTDIPIPEDKKFSSVRGNAYHAFGILTENLPTDSDGDGVYDLREILDGTDPADASSFNPLSVGLVVFYEMNSNLKDTSGMGNHLVGQVDMSYEQGRTPKSGQALRFESNNSYAESSKNIGITENQPRTISFWGKFDASSYFNNSIVSYGDASVITMPNSLFFSTANGARFQMWGQYLAKTTLPLSNFIGHNWHHVVYVHDSSVSESRFYIDNILVDSYLADFGYGDAWNTTASKLFLGKFTDALFDANNMAIDDLRIYNRALLTSEIANLYKVEASTLDSDGDGVKDYRELEDGTDRFNPESFNSLSTGLVAYYPLNGNLNDESGFGNNFDTYSSDISLSNNRFGEKSRSINLPDTESYVSSIEKVGITGNQPNSISLWFYADQIPAWNGRYVGTLLTLRDTTRDYAEIGDEHRVIIQNIHGKTWITSHGGYSDFYVQIPENSVNRKWHHLVVVYSEQLHNSAIYIDGTRIEPTIIESWVSNPRNMANGYVNLGATRISDGSFVDGFQNLKISDIRIYNRALENAEVKSIFFNEALTVSARDFLSKNPNLLGHHSQSDYESSRDSGRSDVLDNPSLFGLYTYEQLDANRSVGQNDVLSNPESFGLFSLDSIMDLNLGGSILQKNGNTANLYLQLQTTTDLTNQPFTDLGDPVLFQVEMPGDKSFLRVRSMGPQ